MKQLPFWLVCLLCFSQALFAQNGDDHLKWMQQSLPDVPEWTAWQKKTGELPPDFHQLKKSNLLPDPLRFYDGSVVKNTAGDWAKRRNEIKLLFEKYITGTFPAKPLISNVIQLDEIKGAGYLVRNVRVEFGPEAKASVRIRLVIPNGVRDEKFPVMISPGLATAWASTVLRRGYISAGYAGNDAMDDAAQLKDLYPDHDFATLPRRAWLARYRYRLPFYSSAGKYETDRDQWLFT